MEDNKIELTQEEVNGIARILGEIPVKYGTNTVIEFLFKKFEELNKTAE
jgi:hypothetical protein